MTQANAPADQTIRPHSLRAWMLATRPATLTAAVSPVLVGTALASHFGGVRPLPAVATFVGASLLQIASNFANDVFDCEKGADTAERLGPTRAVQAGLVSGRAMKQGLLVVLALALAVGVYLTSASGPWIVAIGLSSMLSAVLYTGGPYPLGYHGLGDVFVLLFFGFVAVCGTTFVHLGHVPTPAYFAAFAVGALATNILVVNNLRDRHTDVLAGKRTLAVRFGRRGAEIQYIGLLVLSYLIPIVFVVDFRMDAWVLAPLLTLPVAVINVLGVLRDEGKELNAHLVRSAKLVFLFAATFSLGIFLSGKPGS